ncbi:MAG: tRNA epoxyqueuosine(34) reductase QueG [Parvularculaceae bacterium]
MAQATTSERIKARARELGFDAAGVTGAAEIREAPERLRAFLDAGHHGDMAWMADRWRERANPKTLWPDAQSIVMLAVTYGPEADPMALLEERTRGAISVYARGRDYHDIVKKKLKLLARFIVAEFGGEVKVFVDTAPVMEKPLGAAAGIGWQGKHTNLLSRELGSWFFLGAVFSSLSLEADAPEGDHCGSCRKCLDACPTDAFPAPYQLDARRCISYLTIEHKGPIPEEFRSAIGNRIYGCDDCLAACPWNKYAKAAHDAQLQAREDMIAPALQDLAALDDEAFRARFAGSPVKRTGRARFVRNVLIAIGNSREPRLADVAAARLDDASPLVRGAAVWALGQLLPREALQRLRVTALGVETDASVIAEWRVIF